MRGRPTRIQRCGATFAEESNKLAEAMRDFHEVPAQNPISRTTTLMELAHELRASLRLVPTCPPGLIEHYRREIDKRADPNTIKIENTIGHLRTWQATVSELDRHLKPIIALGHPRKAKQYKVILRATMQIALLHDIIDTNPVNNVNPSRRKTGQACGKVRHMNALPLSGHRNGPGHSLGPSVPVRQRPGRKPANLGGLVKQRGGPVRRSRRQGVGGNHQRTALPPNASQPPGISSS